jgi:SAM-dependent methyltransferase
MPQFTCNICGAACSVDYPLADLPREEPTCSCGSTVRFRWIVHALSVELFGESLPLPSFPEMRQIRGIGMSDCLSIAEPLHNEKFDYENTFYHREPRLDIMDESSGASESYDFIVSSEVFEHVPPPAQLAFNNLFRLLKPRGFAVFSVPWIPDGHTKEHFPLLHDWGIAKLRSGPVLVNRKADGELQIIENNLIFHGGPGETLEMRVYTRGDLEEHFRTAGFQDIEVADFETSLEYGICWLPWSRGFVVRKSHRTEPLISAQEREAARAAALLRQAES